MTDEASIFAIGPPGRAAVELDAGRPTRFPDSADHELTECHVPGAQVRAASVRGLMHRHRGEPRQDRFSVAYDEPTATLIVAVCDGVGAFALSQEAASFVATQIPRAYLDARNWPDAIGEVNRQLSGFVADAATRLRLDAVPGDARLATTLVAAAIRLTPGERTASIACTDDSTAWLLGDDGWKALTAQAKHASGLHTGGVRALPHAEPRFRVLETPAETGALFLMSDGVGDPLAHAQDVRDVLGRLWAGPPDVFTFARQVNFARQGELDDRTVVGIWFEPLGGPPA